MLRASDHILTVRQMQAAEQALIDAGGTNEQLMQIAGKGAAEWVWRIAAGRSVTVLCGPGNNGGDGYVIAEVLRQRGLVVSVVAPADPVSAAAQNARASYHGHIQDNYRKAQADILVDCLFGTGLSRGLSNELVEMLEELASWHDFVIAVDLPSGVDSDNGALLSGIPHYDLTIALGAWKWAHWIMPAAQYMGSRQLVPIGIDASNEADFTTPRLLSKPRFDAPNAAAHKYSRGLVAIVAGDMPGAAQLAAKAAMRGGAGYVKILTGGRQLDAPSELVVDSRPLSEALSDERISALVAGPGLGTGARSQQVLEIVLNWPRDIPTVLDADALNLIGKVDWPPPSERTFVLTPHSGELAQLRSAFEPPDTKGPLASKVHHTIELDWMTDATIVAKGPDTIIFNRDLGMAIAPPASSWLSVAGTGDVLAGIIASRLATGADPFVAACDGVWLHGRAARLAGGITGKPFTASELAGRVAQAYAACL
ncbi:bifunctional ADP-dependent NAD(P)H-hydrate dehydratase/NAD(P)H-hydrate epimerase [Pontixanthobacter gangjinensis]|uniref:Bifunctional NAD(P)H-hydrate repair enzyme n=2 Tax=Pontixanthobacter gangjinensis TaxID=1028742 RepID=A0A6I4SP52_9SPHN|nr:NAD(P)H-hydrate dehydratase [Pontixanthobacter gangjinensis]